MASAPALNKLRIHAQGVFLSTSHTSVHVLDGPQDFVTSQLSAPVTCLLKHSSGGALVLSALKRLLLQTQAA